LRPPFQHLQAALSVARPLASRLQRGPAPMSNALSLTPRSGDQPNQPVLSADEALAIEDATASAPIAPPHETFLACFMRCVAVQPQASALGCGQRMLGFAELDARSGRLAVFLRACGVRRGLAVAVCLKPSLEVLVSFLAIFKAEGVYVPLDPG